MIENRYDLLLPHNVTVTKLRYLSPLSLELDKFLVSPFLLLEYDIDCLGTLGLTKVFLRQKPACIELTAALKTNA